MADQKLTALTELTAPTVDDIMYIVDDPAGTPSSKKISLTRLLGLLNRTNDFRLSLASGQPAYAPAPATPSSTDTAADTTTFATAHGWVSGTIVTPASTIAGLTGGTRYFINAASSTTISFHTTVAAALAGTSKVDLTANVTVQIIPSGISNTTIYMTPYRGQAISIYDGTRWKLYTSVELSLALGVLTSGKNYDVFVYDNSGTLTLELLVWTDDTTRATAIVQQDGVWVKSGATTRRYLGTLRTDSTTTSIVEFGGASTAASVKLFVFNADNEIVRPFFRFESTSSWAYSTGSFRQANASTNNQIEAVVGLPGRAISIMLAIYLKSTSGSILAQLAVGEDSTTVPSLSSVITTYFSVTASLELTLTTFLNKHVPIGYHFYTWLELGGTNITFYGTNGATHRFGMSGQIVM
jgi:hypothetical protein